jgi:membrane protease YdiL (CAAX protease family)
VAILVVFLVIDHLQDILSLAGVYRRLYERFPFFPEGGKESPSNRALPRGGCQPLADVLARDGVLWADDAPEATRELGITPRLAQGLAFGVGASAPMFIGFAVTTPLAVPPVSAATAYLAGLSPLAEEILYRGFACGLLYTRAGMPAWAALGLQASVFGWGHVEQGASLRDALGLFLLLASGGLFYGWFFLRWARNIWVPFALHASMNLSREVFQVGETALGGWYAFTLQSATMVLGIVFTLRWTKDIRRTTLGSGVPHPLRESRPEEREGERSDDGDVRARRPRARRAHGGPHFKWSVALGRLQDAREVDTCWEKRGLAGGGLRLRAGA